MSQKQWTNPEEQQRHSREEAMQRIEGGTGHIGGGVSLEGTVSQNRKHDGGGDGDNTHRKMANNTRAKGR